MANKVDDPIAAVMKRHGGLVELLKDVVEFCGETATRFALDRATYKPCEHCGEHCSMAPAKEDDKIPVCDNETCFDPVVNPGPTPN